MKTRSLSFGTRLLGVLSLGVAILFTVPRIARAIDIEKCVIVMFEQEVMSLPVGVLQCSLDSVTVTLSPVQLVLQEHDAVLVAAFFPGFDAADTLATSILGAQCWRTDWSRVFLIELPSTEALASLIVDLNGVPGVVYAEAATVDYELFSLPYGFPWPCVNDEVFVVGDQWQFQNFGMDAGGDAPTGTYDADIDLVEAWEIEPGEGIRVAVFDEGVYENHEDLVGKVFGDAGYSGGHGTAVAGLIAATGNNGVAIIGVNPNAEIDDQNVLGPGDLFSNIGDAVNRVISLGIPIVNMSYGTGASTTHQMLMRDAYNAGVLLVAAVGYNHTPGLDWPASYSGVTAVGYTDADDEVPDQQATTTWIDVVAPGDFVYSLSTFSSVDWDAFGGTSAAAPLVTGVASLLLSNSPALDNDDLHELIVRSTDDINGTGEWTSSYGHGRLNAQKALELLHFPNEFHRAETEGDTEIAATLVVEGMRFIGVPGVFSFERRVKRYAVTRDIVYPVEYVSPPEVWGRGARTNGFSPDTTLNYGYGHCEVVPGSTTSSGCTLRTYVYELFYPNGSHYMWVPAAPEDVEFAYSVVGRVDHDYRISSYVRPDGTDDLLPMPANWAIGCPGGDVDTIIVEVKLDAADFPSAPPKESFLLSQPHNAGAGLFPDCSAIIADDDSEFATDTEFPNGCYKARFTISAYGGFCGVDSLRVRYNGGLLGYVPVKIKSPDMVATDGSRATVQLGDYARFGTHYPSPPKAFEARADFVAPSNTVNIGDFAFFANHYASGGHSYDPPSLVAGRPDIPVEQGSAIVDLEESIVNGDRRLNVTVGFEDVDPYQVAFVALRTNNERLEFVSWEQDPSYDGETMSAPVTVGDDELLAVGAIATKNATFDRRLGVANFSIVGEEALVLDAHDFQVVIADVLLANGVEGPLSSERRVDTVLRFENALHQNFPNPFNPSTTIAFSLEKGANVRVAVYDVAGRRVRSLLDERREKGLYRVSWDGRDNRGQLVASGVYFCKLVSGEFEDTKKMMLLK